MPRFFSIYLGDSGAVWRSHIASSGRATANGPPAFADFSGLGNDAACRRSDYCGPRPTLLQNELFESQNGPIMAESIGLPSSARDHELLNQHGHSKYPIKAPFSNTERKYTYITDVGQ